MSRLWPGKTMEDATALGGWGAFGSIGRNGDAFRSLYASEQGSRPWNVTHPTQPTRDESVSEPVDPIEEAAQEAFLQGFEEGERLAREAAARDNDARTALAAAIGQIAQAGEGELAQLLSQAVVRLVTQIIGEVPIDPAVLKARCEAVAACIDSDESRAVLEVNPDDMPLLETEPMAVTLVANPQLSRGSVRIATAEGWVEDGPDVRLARLRALLDDMEGRL
ncbi:MAG TPA: FliH/SctL family protein [Sphingobium sp.]|nr:FliH/SctL family protein [Sphingobium sp.]